MVLITATNDVAFIGACGASGLACEWLFGWAGGGLVTSHEIWGVDTALLGVLDWYPGQAGGEACALEICDLVLITATDDVAFLGAGRTASLTCEGLSGWARCVLVMSHGIWGIDAALFRVLDWYPSEAGGEARAFEICNLVLVTATDNVAFFGAGGASGFTSEGLSRITRWFLIGAG